MSFEQKESSSKKYTGAKVLPPSSSLLSVPINIMMLNRCVDNRTSTQKSYISSDLGMFFWGPEKKEANPEMTRGLGVEDIIQSIYIDLTEQKQRRDPLNWGCHNTNSDDSFQVAIQQHRKNVLKHTANQMFGLTQYPLQIRGGEHPFEDFRLVRVDRDTNKVVHECSDRCNFPNPCVYMDTDCSFHHTVNYDVEAMPKISYSFERQQPLPSPPLKPAREKKQKQRTRKTAHNHNPRRANRRENWKQH